jgi:hypothetical protein
MKTSSVYQDTLGIAPTGIRSESVQPPRIKYVVPQDRPVDPEKIGRGILARQSMLIDHTGLRLQPRSSKRKLTLPTFRLLSRSRQAPPATHPSVSPNHIASGSLDPRRIDQHMSRSSGVKTTDVCNILPASQFVPVPLRRCEGQVVWINRNLWHEMNPGEPFDQAQVEKELERYFYIVDESPPGSTPRDQAKTGYADRYIEGGAMRGAGRCYFMDEGSGASIKGGGRTPLARPLTSSASHQDGRMEPLEAVREAAAGEVLHHLGIPTTRILAIISPDLPWKGVSGFKSHPLLAVRIGPQLRIAHLMNSNLDYKDGLTAKVLTKITGSVEKKVHTTYLQYMFANMTAKFRRFRILHGSLTYDNIGLGSSIDYGTVSGLPDTGPHFALNPRWFKFTPPEWHGTRLFGGESKIIKEQATKFSRKPLPPRPGSLKAHLLGLKSRISKLRPPEPPEYLTPYRRAKTVETLCACGLKREIAERLVDEKSSRRDVYQLTKALRQLARPFHANVPTNSRAPFERSSVFDVYKFLADAPEIFFDAKSSSVRTPELQELLTSPYYLRRSGDGLDNDEAWRDDIQPLDGKYAVRSAAEARKKVTPHLQVVQNLYPKVMQRAFDLGMTSSASLYGQANSTTWDGRQDFLTCLSNRAKFENRPLDALYLHDIDAKVTEAVKTFDTTTRTDGQEALYRSPEGKQLCDSLGTIVNNAVASSVRSIDTLLFDSPVFSTTNDDANTPLEQRSFILQPATIEHGMCYLEADLQGRRTLHIEIPIAKCCSPAELRSGASSGIDAIHLTRSDNLGEVEVQTQHGIGPSRFKDDLQVLHVTVPVAPYDYRELRGSLQVGELQFDFGNDTNHYSYAVPDHAEFEKILALHGMVPQEAGGRIDASLGSRQPSTPAMHSGAS